MLWCIFIAQASQPVQLEAIDVLASPLERSRVAGSAHYLDEKKLEAHHYTDVHRVLGDTPGVYVREEDGFGLRPNIGMRGVDSDRSAKVTLMEDGVLFAPAPYSAPAAYYFPLLSRMRSTEVWKGPAAIRFGPNTIGGALNFLTRRAPARLSGEVDAAAGMYGHKRATAFLGWGNDSFALSIDGGFLANDGFKKLPSGANTGFDKGEWVAKAGWHSSYDAAIVHAVDVKVGYGYERSNETYLGLTDADFAVDPYQRYAASSFDRMQWQRTQVRADYSVTGGELWELGLTLYRHDLSRLWRRLNGIRGHSLDTVLRTGRQGQSAIAISALDGSTDSTAEDGLLLAGNNRRFVSQGAQLVFGLHPELGPVRQDIEVGIRLHYDEIVRLHTQDVLAMRGGVPLWSNEPQTISTSNKASTWAGALYVQDKITWQRLLVVPGVRLEYLQTRLDDRLAGSRVDGNTFAWMPGLGAHYAITDWIGVLAGVHKGFSPKAPGQAARVQPEQSINYEAGVRAQHPRVNAEAIGFFNDYQNLTGECTFSSGCDDARINLQFNAGRAHGYGVEASAQGNIPLPAALTLRLGTTYTLTMSRFLQSFDSQNPLWGAVQAGDALPYVPVHQLATSVGLDHARFGVDVRGRYNGEMRDTAGQGAIAANERIPSYFYVDLAAHVQLDVHSRVYVSIDNVLDTKYAVSRRPFGLRPGKPFMLQAGVKLAF